MCAYGVSRAPPRLHPHTGLSVGQTCAGRGLMGHRSCIFKAVWVPAPSLNQPVLLLWRWHLQQSWLLHNLKTRMSHLTLHCWRSLEARIMSHCPLASVPHKRWDNLPWETSFTSFPVPVLWSFFLWEWGRAFVDWQGLFYMLRDLVQGCDLHSWLFSPRDSSAFRLCWQYVMKRHLNVKCWSF